MASRADTGAPARRPRITRPTRQSRADADHLRRRGLWRRADLAAGAAGVSGLPPISMEPSGWCSFVGVMACFFQVFQLFSSARLDRGNRRPPRRRNAAERPPRLAGGDDRHRAGARARAAGHRPGGALDARQCRLAHGGKPRHHALHSPSPAGGGGGGGGGGLLIFLGLLGTFFGLATTIPAVVDTIRSLQPGEGEAGVGGVRPSDGRARGSAGRQWARRSRQVAAGPCRIAGRGAAGALRRARAEPLLPRSRRNGWPRSRGSALPAATAEGGGWTAAPSPPCSTTWSTRWRRCKSLFTQSEDAPHRHRGEDVAPDRCGRAADCQARPRPGGGDRTAGRGAGNAWARFWRKRSAAASTTKAGCACAPSTCNC